MMQPRVLPIRSVTTTVGSLIRPMRVETFVDQVWGVGTHFAHGALAGAPAFHDIDSFEAIVARVPGKGWLHLARGGLSALPDAMLTDDGMADLRGLRAALIQGHTLYLTKGERLDPILAMWSEAIAADLAGAGVALEKEVSAHLFLTPPASQGFAAHRDAHGSFIVQLEGAKDWVVYEPPARNAAADRGPGPVPVAMLDGLASQSFRLEAGDVLYMPEWWPHEARAGDRASLHVTFRVFPRRRESTQGDLRRQRVPARPRAAGTFSQIGRLPELHGQSRLARKSPGPFECFTESGRAHLLFPGGELAGPEPFLPVFRFVIRRGTFRPVDLPDLEQVDYDRLELLRTMIRDGLLEFRESV